MTSQDAAGSVEWCKAEKATYILTLVYCGGCSVCT